MSEGHNGESRGPSPYQAMLSDADAPYPFTTDIGEGYQLLGKLPYPDVIVLESKVVHVRALKYHILLLHAEEETQFRVEQVRIGRLVAELEGDGGEVEIQRFLLPTDSEDAPVDESRCDACLMTIPEGEAKVVEGRAYHRHCYLED